MSSSVVQLSLHQASSHLHRQLHLLLADELKQTIDKHGSQAKDLDTAGERAGKKDRIDNEDSAPEGEAVADKKPKSFQKRETASKNEESDGRQDAASGQQAKAGKEQPRLRQAKRPAGQGRNIKGRRDESPGKKAQVDKQQPSAAGKERPSQKEVRRKKPSDKEATVGKQHIAASQEQKAASKDEDYLAQLTDLPPVHSVNERSDQAEDAFASNAKRGGLLNLWCLSLLSRSFSISFWKFSKIVTQRQMVIQLAYIHLHRETWTALM